MAHDVIFTELAASQLASIPAEARAELAKTLEHIAADPASGSPYSPRYPPDMRTTTFGSWGVIVYVIRERANRVIVLDLTWAA